MPMFDLPQAAAPAVGEPTGRRQTPKKKHTKIVWTAYRPKNRVPCDLCLADLVDAGGVGPLARAARWRRQHGKKDSLLCTGHMELQRQADGFEPLADANGALR